MQWFRAEYKINTIQSLYMTKTNRNQCLKRSSTHHPSIPRWKLQNEDPSKWTPENWENWLRFRYFFCRLVIQIQFKLNIDLWKKPKWLKYWMKNRLPSLLKIDEMFQSLIELIKKKIYKMKFESQEINSKTHKHTQIRSGLCIIRHVRCSKNLMLS